MSVIKINKSSGFSLLELVTVLLIITVLSTIAIRSTVDIGYSVRFEQTRDVADNIRKAIMGNPGNSINGQPDISGFVADMGRPPDQLRELLQRFSCTTSANKRPNDCLATEINWDDTITLVSGVGGIKFGWNGPYLQTSEPATNGTALGDGWANESADNNYGWSITSATNIGDSFSIKSKGKDQIINADGCVNYEDDCEYKISGNEYSKTFSEISILITPMDKRDYADNGGCSLGSCSNVTYTTFQACVDNSETWMSTYTPKQICMDNGGNWTSNITSTNPVTPQKICLRIFYREADAVTSTVNTTTDVGIAEIIENGIAQSITFEYDSNLVLASVQPTAFPNGINAIGIYKHDGVTTCLSGDINLYPAGHILKQVVFAPYKSIDNIVW